MAHEYWMVEVVLWIEVMIISGIGSLGIYRIYRKGKKSYTLGVALFFLLILFSRICVSVLVYQFGYDGQQQYLVPYPTLLWLQIGYNVLSYTGVFILFWSGRSY